MITVLALLSPQVWSLANTIWKDIFMGAAMLVAVALLQRRRWWLAFACIVLAALFRHNALLAGGPLLVYASMHAWVRWRVRIAAFVIGMSTLVVGPKLVESAMGAEDIWPFGAIAAYDLGGVLSKERSLWTGSAMSQFTSKKKLARRFRPCRAQRIVSEGKLGIPGLRYGELTDNRVVIWPEWNRVIKARPDLYLAHRFETFECALGLTAPDHVMKYISGGRANEYGLTWKTSDPKYRWLLQQRNAMNESGLMLVPWQWCVVLMLLTIIALALRRWLALATVLSGLAYAAGYFVASASAELRYYFWDILAVFAALLLILERPPSTSTLVTAPGGDMAEVVQVRSPATNASTASATASSASLTTQWAAPPTTT